MSTRAPSAHHTFLHLLVNTAVAGLTTSFLWFALTFWAYLETRSVLATGLIGGSYMLLISGCSIFFGSVVDHHRKIMVMRASTIITLTLFVIGGLIYRSAPPEELTNLSAPWFWMFAGIILVGAVVEHLRNIALSTTVTILIPDDADARARANGLVGTVQGIAFLATSVLSGLSIGLLGMGWTLALSIVLVALGLVHLVAIRMPQEPVAAALALDAADHRIDLAGSLAVIRASSGLLALILFSTFNNFAGGVYMALLDPYGLEMFAVEIWGIVMGVASTGFIVGGMLVARFGLGRNPMRTLLLAVAVMGLLGATFTVREWWWLFAGGIFLYMLLVPTIEAAEQTVIQRVVPVERQGRVFGLAMAVETAAAPLTAFAIAPIAEAWIIPFAASARGQEALAPFVGVGTPVSRGIALVFLIAGLVMAVVALLALLSPAYRSISRTYLAAAPTESAPIESDPGDDRALGMPTRIEPGEVVLSTSAAVAASHLGEAAGLGEATGTRDAAGLSEAAVSSEAAGTGEAPGLSEPPPSS